MLKLRYLFTALFFLFCICESKRDRKSDTTEHINSGGTIQEAINKNSGTERAIEDTMILNGILSLRKTPDSEGEKIVRLERCTVFVIDKTLIPNKTYLGQKTDYYIKVQTTTGQSGYLWEAVLITKSQFKAHNDSLAMWSKLPMPSYNKLIGTMYYKNSELPVELGSGAFISVGEENRYGIISVYNKYTDNYSYLFFVVDSGHNTEGDNGLLILDIIPLDWRHYGAEVSLKMRQCECVDAGADCSEVVAVYAHTEEMAKKGILFTPEKAWRPDYLIKKLVEIPVESVKCGSQAPEEYDEEDFPG